MVQGQEQAPISANPPAKPPFGKKVTEWLVTHEIVLVSLTQQGHNKAVTRRY